MQNIKKFKAFRMVNFMQKRPQTQQEKQLAEQMRIALQNNHKETLPQPKIVSAFRKETNITELIKK
jgi:hypothetical protein